MTTTNTELTPILREVEFTLGQPNRAPSLGAIGNQGVAEGASLPLTLSATDLDTDALAFSLGRRSAPAWVSLTDAGDGTASLSLSPGFDDAGTTA